ncbi:DUF4369 domain-containing protein [Ancylomarina sp. DW003]|nr:DUF4369 domain-containing protein [Ancylomarina sp. DW003]MDE5421964.1 DUF4369 domain-containing protein [Ancylomarina sp. DW003]
MNLKVRSLTLVLFAMMLLFLSNKSSENKEKFVLNGTLGGIDKGEIILLTLGDNGFHLDTVQIVKGKFRFTGDYPIPVSGKLRMNLKRSGKILKLRKEIMLENVKMNFEGSVNNFENAKVTGSKVHADFENYHKGKRALDLNYKKKKAVLGKYNSKASQAEKEALQKKHAKFKKERITAINKYKKDYMWNNPTSHYSAYLVRRNVIFKTIEETYVYVKDLHPDLKKQSEVAKIIERVSNYKKLEIGLDKIMDGVKPIAYRVDSHYKGKRLLDIIYLATFRNNELCALQKDGTILLLDKQGKISRRLKGKSDGRVTSIAVDQMDRIYVMSSRMKKVMKKVRGRMVSKMLPIGVECHIYNKDGEEVTQFTLPDVVYASGCRVVDQHLIVSDCKLKKIQIHEISTGNVLKKMDDMRSCCGILDFSVNKKKEIIVANLGAFRVQGFDYNGNSLMAFGKRGRELGDFHGCCNPVSVATLSNGAIVTVEKDPTRIKVYSDQGAKQIEGIEELVEGCTYIPMIVDSEDNLYLASEKKGIVKCSSVK